MPQIRLKSSSLQDSIDLRGVPTVSNLANIASTQYVQDALNTVISELTNIVKTDITMSDSTDKNQS